MTSGSIGWGRIGQVPSYLLAMLLVATASDQSAPRHPYGALRGTLITGLPDMIGVFGSALLPFAPIEIELGVSGSLGSASLGARAGPRAWLLDSRRPGEGGVGLGISALLGARYFLLQGEPWKVSPNGVGTLDFWVWPGATVGLCFQLAAGAIYVPGSARGWGGGPWVPDVRLSFGLGF